MTRIAWFLLLTALANSTWAQGSAASAGLGGGGGAGGALEFISADPADRGLVAREGYRAEEGSAWTRRQAILTPGDRVEYKFSLEKGAVLLAAVESTAFDPALTVELKGKELARNDDRAEGDQAPFLNFRAPQKGEYVLKVVSYRSAAGGQFTIRLRTALPVDATIGNEEPQVLDPTRVVDRIVVVRVPLKKGRIYDLRTIELGQRQGGEWSTGANSNLIGPTGVPTEDYERLPYSGTALIEAKRDGDFLIEQGAMDASELTTIRTRYREVPRRTTSIRETTRFEVARDRLVVIEFPVKKGDLVRTTTSDQPFNLVASFGNRLESAEPVRAFPGWARFSASVDHQREVVRSFYEDGTFRFVAETWNPGAVQVELTNTTDLPEWKPGEPIQETLALGGAKLLLYRSTDSEITRIFAEAKGFLPSLMIYGLNGQALNGYANRGRTTIQDDLWFPKEGRYIIRLSCIGEGGSGDFVLRREPTTPSALTLGQAGSVPANAPLSVYAVTLEAGKTYELVTPWRLGGMRDLVDPGGKFLGKQVLNIGGREAAYFTPTQSGTHRLWFRSVSGLEFVLREATPPALGGG